MHVAAMSSYQSGAAAVHSAYKPSFLYAGVLSTSAMSRAPVMRPKMLFGKKSTDNAKSAASIKVNGKKSINLEKADFAGDTKLRNILMDNKVDIYNLNGKFNNCEGYGGCGTCVVKIEEGAKNLTPLTA